LALVALGAEVADFAFTADFLADWTGLDFAVTDLDFAVDALGFAVDALGFAFVGLGFCLEGAFFLAVIEGEFGQNTFSM